MNNHQEEALRILTDVANKLKVNISTLPKLTNCKVWFDGNFTVALVNNKYMGASKRNMTDKFNRIIGRGYAISRAVKHFVEVNSARK